LHEVIQATDVPELEVICAGVSQQNCAELLSSPRLAEMLKEADELYDRIVIDSPPVMAVSDPLILLPHVKGVVFVVGSSKTHREDVERTMRKLRECGAPLVGVVMNEVHVSKGHYPEYATPPSPTTGFRPTAADFLKTPISKR
jgi:capsular exopolysaccharide synthesis family protein